MKPITRRVKEARCNVTFPQGMKIAMKADGSGGPVPESNLGLSPAKQLNSESEIIKKHGEIRQAPSEITQGFRNLKHHFGPEGRGSNFGLAAGLLSPFPGKKLKVAGKMLGKAKNYLKEFLPVKFGKIQEPATKFGKWSSKRGQRRPDGTRY